MIKLFKFAAIDLPIRVLEVYCVTSFFKFNELSVASVVGGVLIIKVFGSWGLDTANKIRDYYGKNIIHIIRIV